MGVVVDGARLVGRDGRLYPLEEARWCGEDGSPLLVQGGTGMRRGGIDDAERSQWRYRRALPVIRDVVSLGEGRTPLLKLEIDNRRLLAKVEWFNPTASFKDRGTSAVISLLKQQGITRVVTDSSGNGGASLAAYAAAAGLEALIVVPSGTSWAKTVEARAHGAIVEEVPGPRDRAAAVAASYANTRFYAGHNWHPMFVEGMKLLAYELWEDLGFAAPGAVIVPVGAGSLVLGLSRGFEELLAAGEIDRVPRLLGVQPSNCSPLVRAFRTGGDEVVPVPPVPTVAEGASISRPVRAREVLDAVRRSNGALVSVSESEILHAARAAAARGLFVEPTASLPIAGLSHLSASGRLTENESAVLVLTGFGAKASTAALEQLARELP